MNGTVAKRYRYTGKERDDESGLNYHGARYYALWLCRWISVDPLESKYAAWSSYHYVKCNPINDTDSSGLGGDKDLKNTDQYKNGVINYDYAEWKGWEPPANSGGSAMHNFKIGGYEVQPYYQRDSNGMVVGQPLYYTASKQYDVLEGEPSGGGRTILRDHSRMEYLIMPWGIENFKKNVGMYEKSADVLYYNGLGSFPNEHLSIDKLKALDGDPLGSAWQQWKGAAKNPLFWAGFAGSIRNIGSNNSSKGRANTHEYLNLKNYYRTMEKASEVIEHIQETGVLPPRYITKNTAELAGWKPGKVLGNFAPNRQIGGDIFQNSTKILPTRKGRIWYEADIGIDNMTGRNKQAGTRLLYSNDGLFYVSFDHYITVNYFGRFSAPFSFNQYWTIYSFLIQKNNK